MQKQTKKIIIYGGNGFVGTHVAKCLNELQACTVCLSRTGHKPLHLNDHKWSESVRWCKGDASDPDPKLLKAADTLVLLVGSPPIPTLSKESYAQQVFMNGTTNVNAIEAAAEHGIKRIVLLSAHVPWLMRTNHFGYYKGKALALNAAQQFAEQSEQHSAIVLKPGAIYGKRYLKNGKMVPLDSFMSPLSKIMPWQFISVERVAQRIANAALNEHPYADQFTLIEHCDI